MQEIRSSNTSMVAAVCDPNKSRAQYHRGIKKSSKFFMKGFMKIYFCYYLKSVNMKSNRHLTDLFFHVLTLQAFLLIPLRPKI